MKLSGLKLGLCINNGAIYNFIRFKCFFLLDSHYFVKHDNQFHHNVLFAHKQRSRRKHLFSFQDSKLCFSVLGFNIQRHELTGIKTPEDKKQQALSAFHFLPNCMLSTVSVFKATLTTFLSVSFFFLSVFLFSLAGFLLPPLTPHLCSPSSFLLSYFTHVFIHLFTHSSALCHL